MRGLVLVAMMMVALAACGDDRSSDRARPTTTVETALPATVEPPTTNMPPTTTMPIAVATRLPSSPSTAPDLTAPSSAPATPPGGGDGLSDSIVVTDSVSLVVIDPEDS